MPAKSVLINVDGVQHKRCGNPQCNAVKPVTEFHVCSTASTGYACYCKDCEAERMKKKSKLPGFKEKQSIRWKRYYHKHPERMRARYREFYHSDYGKAQRKAYDNMRMLDPEYKAKKLARANERRRTDAWRNRRNAALKQRRETDMEFRLYNLLKARAWSAIIRRKGFKINSTIELIGCSIDEARAHIESQFKDGMTWDNYGPRGWHIDHIRPCASFDLTDPEQQKICFNYKNLQPLWWRDNLSKNDKWAA